MSADFKDYTTSYRIFISWLYEPLLSYEKLCPMDLTRIGGHEWCEANLILFFIGTVPDS
jgi:hypothetical protein